MSISDSLIENSNGAGIESRANVSASIENCVIKNCSGPAISCLHGQISISDCHLESNALSGGTELGSICLAYCNSKIIKTVIKNQQGHGILTQFGESIIDSVSITNCKRAGITVGGKCTVTNCHIQHCKMGIAIGPDSPLHYGWNKIIRCQTHFHRLLDSIEPINLDSNSKAKHISTQTFEDKYRPHVESLHAALMLDKQKKVREQLLKKRSDADDVLGTDQPYPLSCSSCFQIDNSKQYILCPRCETGVFCSSHCFENSTMMHKKECDWIVDIIQKNHHRNTTGTDTSDNTETKGPKKTVSHRNPHQKPKNCRAHVKRQRNTKRK